MTVLLCVKVLVLEYCLYKLNYFSRTADQDCVCRTFLKKSSSLFQHSYLFFLTLSGIYGVGKAAEYPPVLAVLSHTPDGATQTIAWVGKGIVYDTGGLSIKGKVSTASL